MWEFLAAQSEPLNVVANGLMLVVWTLYFQLLWTDRRRERRPRILINRSAGKDLDANCVVTNMSREAIYLECVAINLRNGEEVETHSLTDLSNLTRRPQTDPRRFWFQGPVASGEYLDLGPFRALLESVLSDEVDVGALQAFEILIVATYGPDRNPTGARRVFRRPRGDAETLLAEGTHQIDGWRERRRLIDLLREGAGEG
jgi:hypothetical protein